MPKAQGRPCMVSMSNGDHERILWHVTSWGKTVQLPLSWGLWRADLHRMQQADDDDKPAELPPHIMHRMKNVAPASLNIYVAYENHVFRGVVTAEEIATQLRNGHAALTVYAPVQKDDGSDEVGAHLDEFGFLRNLSPTEARAAFDHAEPVQSHPLVISSTTNALNAITQAANEIDDSSKTNGHRPDEPEGGRPSDDAHPDSEDAVRKLLDNPDTNPVMAFLFGNVDKSATPGLRLSLAVNLYQSQPGVVTTLVRWQQQRGLLPASRFKAAWTLSTLSSNAIVNLALPTLGALLLLAAWAIVYTHSAATRLQCDRLLETAHGWLPAPLQTRGSAVWHAVADASPATRDWLAHEAAPGFLVGMLVLLPIVTLLLTRSARIMNWWLHAFSLRALGGTVYGLTLEGAAAMTKQAWEKVAQGQAKRPDLARGLQNSAWATEDVQERYWQVAGKDQGKAKQLIKNSALWRSHDGIDSILSSTQEHFKLFKSVFPHGIIGRAKNGCPIFAMKLGPLKEQYSRLEEARLPSDQAVKHCAFLYEWMFNEIDSRPLPHGKVINILDLDGFGIWDLQNKCMSLAKVCSKISEKHYPGRLHRAFIINAPNAVNAVWGLIQPFLDANAQELTSVYTKPNTLKGLQEELDLDDIPKEWGGKRTAQFYDAPDEQEMWQRVADNNKCSLSDLYIEGMVTQDLLSKPVKRDKSKK